MTHSPRTGLRRLCYVASWRVRYWWLDTRAGLVAQAVLSLVHLGLAVWFASRGYQAWQDPPAQPIVHAIADWIVYAIMFVVSALVSMALAPKPKNAEAQRVEVARVEDGATLKRIYGPVWIDDPIVIGDKPMGTDAIRKRAGKTWNFKTKWQTVGFWYKRIFHFMVCSGPIDAVLAQRGGGIEMWSGRLEESGTIAVDKPNLWGGEDSEGGIVGTFDWMFGEADQLPNAYLAANLAPEQSAYRGRTSVAFLGGRWGTSPYFKSPSFLVTRIFKGWDDDVCWYPEKAAVPLRPGGMVGTQSILVTANDGGGGPAVVARAEALFPPVFTEIPKTSGADIDGARGAYANGIYAIAGLGEARYSVDGMATWQSATVPTAADGYGHCGGPAGFLALVSKGRFMRSGPVPSEYTEIPASTFEGSGGAPFSNAHSRWTGRRYAIMGYFNLDTAQRIYLSEDLVGFPTHYVAPALPAGGWHAIYDVAEFDDTVFVAGQWIEGSGSPVTKYQVRRGTDGVVVLELPVDERPVYLIPGSDRLCVLCYNGDVYSSEDDFSEGAFCGVAPGYTIRARLGAFSSGYFYILDAFGQVVASADLKVWSEPTSVGLSPPYESIVGEGVYEAERSGMNLAHVLYDSLVSRAMDGEPVGLVNDASFRAAADRFYAEGFGIGTVFDASSETIEQFQQRLCDLGACRLSRDPTTGEWHLDLIRDDIGVVDLPVLTDDDILEWERQPSVLDEAVNQVIVEWFDPWVKEDRSTAPVQALGAIRAFGSVNGEVRTYREILQEGLALRVAARDLRARATPLDRHEGTTTRVPYSWRTGRKFRLQAPKYGIADSVCILGDTDRGTLRSGAIRVTALQDVAKMPDTVYVIGEPGVDTSVSGQALPAPAQDAFELPYVELVQIVSPADLQVMSDAGGFACMVAQQPGQALDYVVWSRVGGADFTLASDGDWCPTATVVEACTADDPLGGLLRTTFTLAGVSGLGSVEVGTAAYWGSGPLAELVRVDALDRVTGEVEFGRGCGDTVPQPHAAGERIWFHDAFAAVDPLERTDGDSVQLRPLTRTGSDQLPLASALTSTVVMASRQARPYAPAGLLINGQAYPTVAVVDVELEWVHRDRVAQGAQLVDTTMATVGPEAGVTYTARWILNGVLAHEEAGISGTTATYTPATNGFMRVEIEAVRDGLTSWQVLAHDLTFLVSALNPYVDQDADTYADQDGNTYEG